MKTVIMAGGKGTRIQSIAADMPKPMISIEGIPVIEREILSLRDQKFIDFIITVSHMGSQIKDYLGNGSRLSVNIEYFYEETPLGNAGALFELKDKLKEDFLLINADSVFDVDFTRFASFHRNHKGLVSIFAHPNSHPYDSGLIIADEEKRVVKWLAKEDNRPQWYKNRVNAGLHVISPKMLECRPDTKKVDLDRQLLKPLAGTGEMYCYDSPEYVKDMGTPERYSLVCLDYAKGIVKARNLREKQKAIFLDRDGTINKHVGFLRNIDDFLLLPRVAEAIKKINSSKYLAIVVTNQPVISRGEISWNGLQEIHNKMETLLGNNGAYLDAIYVCPHHPQSGYEGEIKELKFDCNCRKPKPGMLLKASDELNIDLSASWMVGDGENDILAGLEAGCKTKRITKEYQLIDAVDEILGEN